jgi:hypothetical protein
MCPVSTVAGESLSQECVCACPAFVQVSSLVFRVTHSTNVALFGRLQR